MRGVATSVQAVEYEVEYLIDVVGTCNLRCPSCPVGNFEKTDFLEKLRPKGFMKLDLFTRILDKIVEESKQRSEPFQVSLYNWGDALLHPEIDKIFEALAERQIIFHLSSNLNNNASFQKLVATATSLRISMSGGANSSYQESHVGGDINLVISNMYRLRHSIDKLNGKVNVGVFYHVYKDNCDDNMVWLAKLSKDLGFRFDVGYAFFMPLEKYLYYLDGSPKFTENDRKTMDRMVLTIDEGLSISRSAVLNGCDLRSNQLVINHDGSVPVCCGVYDPIYFVSNNFLEETHENLQQKRMNADICRRCMAIGAHKSVCYLPNDVWDNTVTNMQIAMRQKYITQMFSRPNILEFVHPSVKPVVL